MYYNYLIITSIRIVALDGVEFERWCCSWLGGGLRALLCDEIQDIRSGSRILRIGEDPIYVANVAAH